MQPAEAVMSAVAKRFVKPIAKKALSSGISETGDKLGKMVANKALEKSGDLIRKRLLGKKDIKVQDLGVNKKGKKIKKTGNKKAETHHEIHDLINKLISEE